MDKETIFREIKDRIDGLLKKAPLPFWMSGQRLSEKEVGELSELAQLEHGTTQDLVLKGVDPDSPQGREESAKVLRQIREDYNWLS